MCPTFVSVAVHDEGKNEENEGKNEGENEWETRCMKKSNTGKFVPNFVSHPDRDRRVRQSERIGRVLKILSLLQSKARWNSKSIASELGCSERTVYRDLEVLQFAGVPWYYDESDSCYRLRADYRFPTLGLTADEVIGQVVAASLSKVRGFEFGAGAVSTTRKMVLTAPENVQQIAADASRLITVLDMKLADHSQHLDAIQTIQAGLMNQRLLAGLYESPYEKRSVRVRLNPYRLCFVKQAWYLIGRLDSEDSPKTFRVARFKSIRMLEDLAAIDEGFDLQHYFGNAWSVFRGETRYAIELRFEPLASKLVTETIWHPTQVAKRGKDGRVTLVFSVDGLNEILHWLLSWTGQVEVIKPDELRVLFRNTLQGGLSLNGDA